HRAQHLHVGAGRDQAGLQGRLEHVAGDARVLADHHRGAGLPAGRQHPPQRIAEAEHEIGRNRSLTDPAADAVGAEVAAGTAHAASRASSGLGWRIIIASRVARRSRNSRRSQIWSMAPCSSRNSERWKPSGSFSRTVCSITRGPAKPISASGSAMLRSPSIANEAETPPVVGWVSTEI